MTANDETHDHHAHHRHRGEEFADMTWEERYQSLDQLWSGQVNGSLVAEAADLSPGRALDVGCGEGADAIWLAEQGWQVMANDLAATAVERGRAVAQERGLAIEWHAGDILDERPPSESFDLVTLHYPAFEADRRAHVVEMLSESVAPGGTLLVVGHAIPDDPNEMHFDPADYVGLADIAEDLDPAWVIETHETRARPGEHHHDSSHSHDVIFRARKPG